MYFFIKLTTNKVTNYSAKTFTDLTTKNIEQTA